MKRTELKIIPEYFDRYINLVADVDLFTAFDRSIDELDGLDTELICKIGNKTYLPGKWTINEILQHVADIERLLIAGTMRFARGEDNHAISFNEEKMARNSKANTRSIYQILSELKSIRQSTIEMYRTFDEDDFQKSGINWKHRISVEAMGFNIIGHQIHHVNFIKNNYYPLAV
ncbi:DinB family protein [Elizabethkingia anophelis]|uniref:DinB family protein n=1 Tax=Elizabethkingia anophelis TaxID=1117645 RepID=UPI00136D7CA6|nr:DinB family protein [Elizabethkingia anophelis]MYZ59122.1 DinB family protein [Elizabethkingia anophelis]